MANSEQLAVLQKSIEAWNQWRQHVVPEFAVFVPDFTGADLSTHVLSGADLRDANLESTNLRCAKVCGTQLSKAKLRFADLYQADLCGADLQYVDFTGANIFEASLREANLQGADLSHAKAGLRAEQLAGANLTGAILPQQLNTLFDSLQNVNNISESARKLFLAVLAACLYSWLTIATTTDVNLITNRASSTLPIIQTSIPIVGFYVVAPLLLLCAYFYFHFYLQKLWEELGSLPAVFPDGRPLHTKIDPWLLNDLVRAHLPKLNVNRPFLSYLQLWISVLLAWWLIPITMLVFWGRYLRRHERTGTIFHEVLLVISLVAAIRLYGLAVSTLRGTERKPFEWKGILRSRRGYKTAAFAVAAEILFAVFTWRAMLGTHYSKVPEAMAHIGYPPSVNLRGAEVSQKKSTWNGKSDTNLDSVIGAQLSKADLRDALADSAFFVGADLSLTNLTGASLNHADLNGADLRQADLSGADLRNADLSSADLSKANLTSARLHGAVLTHATLSQAKLFDTKLIRANLGRVDLSWHDLRGAILKGTDLSSLDMSSANLNGADLSNANLDHVNLSNADLRSADLAGANLSDTNLWRANLRDANLRNVTGYIHVQNALNWDHAFYDSEKLKALKLPPNHNDMLVKQQKREKELQQNQTAGEAETRHSPH